MDILHVCILFKYSTALWEPKTLVNPFQVPKQFFHMSKGIFSQEISKNFKNWNSIFQFLGKSICLHITQGHIKASLWRKLRLYRKFWVLCCLQVPLKKKVNLRRYLKIEKMALDLTGLKPCPDYSRSVNAYFMCVSVHRNVQVHFLNIAL